MNQDTQKSRDWLDGAAVALSALCLVHCLALPLVVAGFSFGARVGLRVACADARVELVVPAGTPVAWFATRWPPRVG